MNAQKIVEIKAQQQTLWEFLAALPVSVEAQVLYGLVLSGLVGLLSSWLWKWSQGQADGWRHFTLRYAIGQVLWIVGSAIAMIATMGFTTDSGEFFGWLSVIVTGGLAGFSGEVKTSRPDSAHERRGDQP